MLLNCAVCAARLSLKVHRTDSCGVRSQSGMQHIARPHRLLVSSVQLLEIAGNCTSCKSEVASSYACNCVRLPQSKLHEGAGVLSACHGVHSTGLDLWGLCYSNNTPPLHAFHIIIHMSHLQHQFSTSGTLRCCSYRVYGTTSAQLDHSDPLSQSSHAVDQSNHAGNHSAR